MRTFFVLGSRKGFKARMVHEGDALAAEVTAVAEELRPRVVLEPQGT